MEICAAILGVVLIAVVTRILTALPKIRKSNETIFDNDIFHRGE